MAAQAILNRLEPQLNVIRHALHDIKIDLRSTDARLQDAVEVEEQLEDRVEVLEEKVELIKENLNTVIDRINVLQEQLKTFTKDNDELAQG